MTVDERIITIGSQIEQLLKSKGAQVHAFHLYVVGEGLEKRKDDFVAEVMAQAKQAGR